jgi:thiamine pyrophosphokinase
MKYENEVIPLNRCVIITSYQSASLKESMEIRPDDFIICADGGYSHARSAGIVPHMVIGDFDSVEYGSIENDIKRDRLTGCRIERVAAEKDDTDTMICVKYGIDQGYDDFFIIGGLGGRLDHTVANLQTMSYAVEQGKTIWFLDGKNRATLRQPGSLTVEALEDYKISLFAFGESCEGVSISGVKYPLRNHMLTNNFPLGVSNEFLEIKAEISHTSGKLLVILSQD